MQMHRTAQPHLIAHAAASALHLAVDGTDEYGNFAGDAQAAPFVVFDIDKQENIAGPYRTRGEAERAMEAIQRGKRPALDVEALLAYREARYLDSDSTPIGLALEGIKRRLSAGVSLLLRGRVS